MHIRALVAWMIVLMGCTDPSVRPANPRPFESFAEAQEDDPEITAACTVHDPEAVPECLPDEGPMSRRLEEAFELYRLQKYEDALPIFGEAIDRKTGDKGCAIQKAILQRGRALFNLGRHREAFDDFVRFTQAGWSAAYYWSAADWMEALQDHLPKRAIAVCVRRRPLICWPEEERHP